MACRTTTQGYSAFGFHGIGRMKAAASHSPSPLPFLPPSARCTHSWVEWMSTSGRNNWKVLSQPSLHQNQVYNVPENLITHKMERCKVAGTISNTFQTCQILFKHTYNTRDATDKNSIRNESSILRNLTRQYGWLGCHAKWTFSRWRLHWKPKYTTKITSLKMIQLSK